MRPITAADTRSAGRTRHPDWARWRAVAVAQFRQTPRQRLDALMSPPLADPHTHTPRRFALRVACVALIACGLVGIYAVVIAAAVAGRGGF